MAHPELIEFITEQLQEGVSADIVRQALVEAGWRESDVSNALHDVAAGFASVGALPMQAQLLPGPVPTRFRHISALATAVGASLLLTFYASPIIALALGILFLFGGYKMMRARHAWSASLLTDSAIAALGVVVWAGYRSYHLMEWPVVAALLLLLVVLLVVMERWITRLS